jgi:hypothetical protein
LSSEDDGLNSRERAFPLRLTFECFLWQIPSSGVMRSARRNDIASKPLGQACQYALDQRHVPSSLLTPDGRENTRLTGLQIFATFASQDGKLRPCTSRESPC